jgi:vitamin B12 transporter
VSNQARGKRAMLCACVLISGVIVLQIPGTCAAEEEDKYSFDQVVVTANRVPTKIFETAANVTVITREQIEKGNYQNLGEILNHVPGISIANNGGPGSISAAFINGSEQVVVMIDGRRMNLPNGIGGFGKATTNLTGLIGVNNIERIEVIKGGRSALYGADAVGGVINIITKKGEKNQTTVKVASGNWDGYDYSLATEGKEGNLSWYVTADTKHLGNYSDGKGKKYDYTGKDQNAYTLRLDQKINDGNLSFSYENFNSENEGKSATSYDNTLQHNWDLTYTEDLSKNTDYEVKFYQNANHRFGYNNEAYDHDVRIKGFNYQINSKVDANNMLTTGIDWRKDEIESSNYGNKDNTVGAVYLQNKWNITDKLILTPGVRYDKNDTYGNKTTPQIGVNYKQNENTSYYASWGKVFQAPRFDDLYWPHQHYKANPIWGTKDQTYDGNPNLKPETGWNAEIGITHRFDDTLEGKISYFNRKLNDAITWKDISSDNNKEHWVPLNVNEQEASGFEVQLSKKLTSEWSTFVGYNYLNVKNKTQESKDFVRDSNIADRTWNVGMAYNANKVSADIKGTAVTGRTNSEFKEKDYWLWDANLNVKLDKDYTAFMTVNNIFDEYYDRAAGYPCGGRNYVFGVRVRF